MKTKVIFIIVIIIIGRSLQAQNFEGKVVYMNYFTSKIKNLTGEQLSIVIGNEQNYFIQNGCYKSLLNGHSIVSQIYDPKTNRLYNRKYQSDTLYWFNASINTDEVIDYQIKEKVESILGYECDEIIMKTPTGTSTYYYSSKFKINSKLFENHKYGNWAFYTSKTRSLPLKITIETNQFKMESIAVGIESIKLGNQYFEIDSHLPIIKGR